MQNDEQLRKRFHRVVESTRQGPAPKPMTAKEPTRDEALTHTLATYLDDDRAKFLLTWLDQEAANANTRAHQAAVTGRDQKYSLGQESAFRSAARKIRDIRGEATPL